MQSLGFNEVWLFQGVGNINVFLSAFTQRIKDTFIQKWNERLINSSRARTYSLFSSFSYKIYLDLLSVEKFRYALARIRVSSHRLAVEAGRWHRPNSIPLDERKCNACNVLEDEFHFILECSLYKELRKTYIKRYFWIRPNIIKFTELMTSENHQIIKNLATFVHASLKVRANVP